MHVACSPAKFITLAALTQHVDETPGVFLWPASSMVGGGHLLSSSTSWLSWLENLAIRVKMEG